MSEVDRPWVCRPWSGLRQATPPRVPSPPSPTRQRRQRATALQPRTASASSQSKCRAARQAAVFERAAEPAGPARDERRSTWFERPHMASMYPPLWSQGLTSVSGRQVAESVAGRLLEGALPGDSARMPHRCCFQPASFAARQCRLNGCWLGRRQPPLPRPPPGRSDTDRCNCG